MSLIKRDAETFLDYFGARYYRPMWGRFTSVDPIMDTERATLDPQRWNRYAYAKNSPARYIDPDGREAFVAINRVWLEKARELREAVTRRLGGGLIASVADALLAPFAPTTSQEVADSAMASMAPAGMVAGRVGQLARTFGLVDFVEAGSLVGGRLANGANVAVSFARLADTLAVNISVVAGPRGTLAALEAGAMRAAMAEGAATVRLVASNVSKEMARLLRRNGFIEKLEGGATIWVKEVAILQ